MSARGDRSAVGAGDALGAVTSCAVGTNANGLPFTDNGDRRGDLGYVRYYYYF